MKRKNDIDFGTLGAALLILLGVVGVRMGLNKLVEERNEEASAMEETLNEPTHEPVVYYLHYENDTVDVEESINSLNISEDKSFPYECYKYIRFVDYDHIERYAIVNVYVDYLTDENKNVTATVYKYVDTFSGRELFTTTDKDKIKEIDNEEVMHLMEYGDLLELRESVISRGLDINYAYSVFQIKKKAIISFLLHMVLLHLLCTFHHYFLHMHL